MAEKKHSDKSTDQTLDGFGVTFEDAMQFLSKPSPIFERSFEERIELLTKEIIKTAHKYGLNPPERIFNHFILHAEEPFISRDMTGDINPELMNECNVLYRLYFPEGQ